MTLRSVLAAVVLLLATAGNAQTAFDTLPDCGKSCVNNLKSNPGSLGCSDASDACLCSNQNFQFGIRDCARSSCPDQADSDAVVNFAAALCATATATTSTAPTTSTAEPSSSDAAAAVPFTTSSSTTQPATTSSTSSSPMSTHSSTAKPSTLSTSLTKASSSTATTSSTSSSTAAATAPSLSPGAKAGIGAGVGAVGLVLLAAGLYMCFRRGNGLRQPANLPRGNKSYGAAAATALATQGSGYGRSPPRSPPRNKNWTISEPIEGSGGRVYAHGGLNRDGYEKDAISELDLRSRRYEDMVPRQVPRNMV